MIALLQRVSEASVHIDGAQVAGIGRGLAVLVGVERDDDERRADRLLERVLGYRVFSDANGRMNLNLGEIEGGLLLVPQFTLAADTRKGMRPGFSTAAEPKLGKQLFSYLKERAEAQYHPVACGVFGADMKLALVNDGPVTFRLES
ncbi:MAG: D-aminoacyl-tRNA deacylase [Candidatus Thiodiazotropha sp.]